MPSEKDSMDINQNKEGAKKPLKRPSPSSSRKAPRDTAQKPVGRRKKPPEPKELYYCNANKILCIAAKEGLVNLAISAIQGGANVCAKDNEALCLAAKYGKFTIVEILLESGANVNARNGLPMALTAEYGHINAADVLVAYGADVSINHYEAFHRAAVFNNFEVLELMVFNGGSPPKLDESFRASLKKGTRCERYLRRIFSKRKK